MMTLEQRLRFGPASLRPPRLPDADVAYSVHLTLVGPLVLAVDGDGAVLSCSYDDEQQVTEHLARAVSPRVLRQGHRLDPLRRQLDEYLAGQRLSIDLAVNLALASAFTRQVLTSLPDVAYGTTTSYGDLAARAGAPRAARAVGNALGANPVCIVLPCHRVTRSDGSPGGYAGGPSAKKALLDLEAGATRET